MMACGLSTRTAASPAPSVRTSPVLSVAEARARILAPLRPTPAEIVALSDAWGRVTAAALTARLTMPPAAVSSMDGYALRAADGQLGAVLQVVGSAPAGHPYAGQAGPGQAVRLFTGSVVPPGADSVIIQEDVRAEADRITLGVAVQPGQHIRPAGLDFSAGDELAPAGIRLGARTIGLAAAGNHAWAAVHRRPRIGILATGDEIGLPGDPIGPGGIVSSNAHALAGLVRAGGGEPMLLPIARDSLAALAGAVRHLSGLDMLVTTGGASVGEHDLVRDGLGPDFALGFWRIAMRPGKPLLSGTLGGIPVLGLPGNPVSALVCAVLFLWPALARLSGLPGAALPLTPLPLGTDLPANDHREDYLRAALRPGPDGAELVMPFPRQDSSMMRTLAQADALVMRPPNASAIQAGALVSILRLDAFGL